jgi:hypothetical protein
VPNAALARLEGLNASAAQHVNERRNASVEFTRGDEV